VLTLLNGLQHLDFPLRRRCSTIQYSTVVGWGGPSVPRGSLGLMGMMCTYRTPVSQVGFVGDRNPPPSLPSIPVAFLWTVLLGRDHRMQKGAAAPLTAEGGRTSCSLHGTYGGVELSCRDHVGGVEITQATLRNKHCMPLCLVSRLHMPELHLHAEEVVLSLVRMRKKQLAMAAAVEAARNATPPMLEEQPSLDAEVPA